MDNPDWPQHHLLYSFTSAVIRIDTGDFSYCMLLPSIHNLYRDYSDALSVTEDHIFQIFLTTNDYIYTF